MLSQAYPCCRREVARSSRSEPNGPPRSRLSVGVRKKYASIMSFSFSSTHGSLIFIGVLRIYNVLYFLLLEDLSIFLIVFSGLSSAKWAVVHNTIEPALEVLCSSKLNFQFLEMNFQNERTVRLPVPFQVLWF